MGIKMLENSLIQQRQRLGSIMVRRFKELEDI
jgi:hypothetical protein